MGLELGSAGRAESSAARKPRDLIVLGSGPAGLSAALYAARADRAPLILTGQELGGQAGLTHVIENYPGFPEGVGGAELGQLFQKHAERFGAQVELDSATAVDLTQWPFHVSTYSSEYEARTLIIATGASPRKLKVPGEQELTGRGVSYCATCDGWFFKGKDVVVVGGGDSALEEGLFLTRYASHVTIVHRREELRAGRLLRQRAERNEKISFMLNSVVQAVRGETAVTSVMLRNVITGAVEERQTQGVFIFIGHDPNTDFMRGQVELDEKGYVVADTRMRTSVPGVFVAGEAADSVFRQVATSVGMGVAAAMSAESWLAEREAELAETRA
jgi:thioredoxin reductase (NADPH)